MPGWHRHGERPLDDIAELVRLREVMMASVRGEAGIGWQQSCADTLATALPDGSMVAAVVDNPAGDGLAACGVGMLALAAARTALPRRPRTGTSSRW